MSQDVPVIVVGGGAAGLAAARQLLEAGRSVVVLEANDYLGGRVKSWSSEATGTVELGASLIHFRDQALFNTATQREVQVKEKYAMRFLLNGECLTTGFSLIKRLKFLDLFKLRKVFQYFYTYRGDDVAVSHLLDMAKLSENTKKLFVGVYSPALGTWLDNVGLNGLRYSFKQKRIRFEREITSEAVSCEYLSLLSEYVECVIPHVRLNCPVTNIDYSSDRVSVTLANGETLAASEVVITVPLSVLKKNLIGFTPELPANKLTAIEKLGVGAAAKVVLVFSDDFWGRRVGYLIGCDEGVVFLVQNKTEDQYVLVAYVYDAALVAQDDASLVKSVLAQLDECYSAKATRCVMSSYVHNWSNEKYIAGGYSYDAVGSEGCREVLAEPISHKVYFAGEASINGYAATVDGALLSGLNAAKKILET